VKRSAFGNIVASVRVGATGVKPDWTFAQLETAIRGDFNDKMKQKAYLVDRAAQERISREERWNLLSLMFQMLDIGQWEILSSTSSPNSPHPQETARGHCPSAQ
jgi:hypothetical protein